MAEPTGFLQTTKIGLCLPQLPHSIPHCHTQPGPGRIHLAQPRIWWRWHSQSSGSTSAFRIAGHPRPPSCPTETQVSKAGFVALEEGMIIPSWKSVGLGFLPDLQEWKKVLRLKGLNTTAFNTEEPPDVSQQRTECKWHYWKQMRRSLRFRNYNCPGGKHRTPLGHGSTHWRARPPATKGAEQRQSSRSTQFSPGLCSFLFPCL